MTSPTPRPDDRPDHDHTACLLAKEEAAIALLQRREPAPDVLAHLEACPPCRDEYGELAALPCLLDAARAAGNIATHEPPRPQLLDRLLTEMNRRRRRRRFTIALLLGAAAVVAAVAMVALPQLPQLSGLLPSGRDGGLAARTSTAAPRVTTPPTSLVLVAEGAGSDAASGADARVTVRAEGVGSAVSVWVHGWPQGKPCRMVVHDTSGQAQEVGIWTVSAEDESTYVEKVDVPPASIERVELVDDRTGKAMIDVRMQRV